MEPLRRTLATALLVLGLLFVTTFASTFVEYPYLPNLVLPVVVYYGLFAEVSVLRGIGVAFVSGNLLDVFAGSPMSLYTFLLSATFLATRALGARLFLRNVAFQSTFIFIVAVAVDSAALALRLLFELPLPFEALDGSRLLRETAISSLVTALSAPLLYLVVARIEQVEASRKEAGSVAP